MQDQHVPAIGRYYWSVFAVATLFGSTTGDLIAGHLKPQGLIGYYLPVLAAVFGATLYAEARDPAPRLRWYWLAVVLVPTAANELADLSFLYFGLRRIWVAGGFLIVLVVAHLAFQSDATRLIALRLQQRPTPTVPLTDATYWIAMIVTSTSGTLAADFLIQGLRMDLGTVVLIMLVPVAAASGARRWTGFNRTWTYWSVVVAVTAAATAIGDLLAGDPRLGVGLGWSAAVSGGLLAVLLALASARAGTRQHAR